MFSVQDPGTLDERFVQFGNKFSFYKKESGEGLTAICRCYNILSATFHTFTHVFRIKVRTGFETKWRPSLGIDCSASGSAKCWVSSRRLLTLRTEEPLLMPRPGQATGDWAQCGHSAVSWSSEQRGSAVCDSDTEWRGQRGPSVQRSAVTPRVTAELRRGWWASDWHERAMDAAPTPPRPLTWALADTWPPHRPGQSTSALNLFSALHGQQRLHIGVEPLL